MRLMKTAERMGRLGTESAFEVLARAKALERQGKTIVHLEIGEPDFDTPPHIKEAAKRALDAGATHYGPSAGLPELREAIAKHVSETRGVPVSPEQVVVTPGAKPIMFFTIMALVGPGDEVIYPNPGFPIYESVINFVGGTPVPIPLRESSEFGFDLEVFERSVSPRTKLIIVNSPENPTGGVLDRAQIDRIAAIALRHGIPVLSDEIYRQFLYEGEFVSILQVPGLARQTILLDGFSKSYAMTGWRLGYCAAPEPLVKAMAKLQSQAATSVSSITQYAAVEALNGTQSFIPERQKAFEVRRDLVVSMLNQARGLECFKPEGAFYIYPSVRKLIGRKAPSGRTIGTDEDFVTELLSAEGVAVVHGAAFGMSPFFRLSYAASNASLEEACRRIQRFCASLN